MKVYQVTTSRIAFIAAQDWEDAHYQTDEFVAFADPDDVEYDSHVMKEITDADDLNYGWNEVVPFRDDIDDEFNPDELTLSEIIEKNTAEAEQKTNPQLHLFDQDDYISKPRCLWCKEQHETIDCPYGPPGSSRAKDQGCLCAAIDNNHGEGAYVNENGDLEYWIAETCPLHGSKRA